jgi:hypothetical protein
MSSNQYRSRLQQVSRGERRCDCGRVATRIKQSDFVCDRCDEIEKDLEVFHMRTANLVGSAIFCETAMQ